MSSDKVRHKDATQTGSIPRTEVEPILRREIPHAELPELMDIENGSTTGEMPSIFVAPADKTQDEDTPTGK